MSCRCFGGFRDHFGRQLFPIHLCVQFHVALVLCTETFLLLLPVTLSDIVGDRFVS